MVEFEFYIKEPTGYRKKQIIQPSGTGWEFIESLRKTVDNEIENTRIDIAHLFPAGQEVNLKRPVVEDKQVQEQINKLCDIRKQNLKIKEQLSQILAYDEYIICEDCGGKMYKIPIGVSYIKYGNKHILQNVDLHTPVEYIYGCEKCNKCIREDLHIKKMNLRKHRKELLESGESFVPNDFGFWHWENTNKNTKPEGLEDDCKCRHVFKREFERIPLIGQKSPFVKITEKCVYCGGIGFSK